MSMVIVPMKLFYACPREPLGIIVYKKELCDSRCSFLKRHSIIHYSCKLFFNATAMFGNDFLDRSDTKDHKPIRCDKCQELTKERLKL